MIADNPIRVHRGTEAIIHTQQPISIIIVDEGHVATKWPHRHFTFTNSDEEQEEYTLSLFHCFTTSFDGEEHNVMIDKLFRNAWHWYMSYMNWEDKQIDEL